MIKNSSFNIAVLVVLALSFAIHPSCSLPHFPLSLPDLSENAPLSSLLNLTRIIHIGTVTSNFNVTTEFIANLFGVGSEGQITDDVWTVYRGQPTLARAILAFIPITSDDFKWEVIQPADDYPSFWSELLKEYGSFFHHYGITVDNIDETRTVLENMGFPTVQCGQGKTWGCYCYCDLREALGVVVELLDIGRLNCTKPN